MIPLSMLKCSQPIVNTDIDLVGWITQCESKYLQNLFTRVAFALSCRCDIIVSQRVSLIVCSTCSVAALVIEQSSE